MSPILIAAASAMAAQPVPETPEPVPAPPIQAATAEDDASPLYDAPNSPDEIVIGESDYYERMTVPVTIMGQGPYRFMIDTGSQATVVTRGLTEKLDLKPAGSATIVAMGSSKPVQLVELNGLEFAERVLDNISAPMLEARHIGADGILGLDSLQDLRVMIDFREDTIAVNDSEALGGNRGYEIIVRARHKLGRLIITHAEIDGIKTAVVLDTGAQGSFGNRKLQRRLRARNPEAVSSTDVNGTLVQGELHFFQALKIQDLQFNNIPITFADSPVFEALGLDKRPALILGMRDLRLFNRVAIDFATNQVLFDVPQEFDRHNRPRDRLPGRFLPSRL